jgi:hypothetical protein
MYGLIHSAARQMVLDQFGGETWRSALERSGLSELHFIHGEVYADEVTLGLIGAIVETTRMPVDALLFEFGRYWITYVSGSAFSRAMAMSGNDFVSFVEGMDRLHRGVRTAMPMARMPSFEVLSSTPHVVEVLYVSERAGLDAFVAGLLTGLLERFGQKGVVTHASASDGIVYSIAIEARAAA